MSFTGSHPNLTSPPPGFTYNYKDILLKKLCRAVACSLIAQMLILLLYIFVANMNLFHPGEWVTSTLKTFTNVSTWLFIFVYITIMFGQCLVCSKDYVLSRTYWSTRFQQIIHIFSLHNFTVLFLHLMIGGVLVWLILSATGSQNLINACEGKKKYYCLIPRTYFLILSGFWTGAYYFMKIYATSKHLVFPVIQQRKFCHFRSNIGSLLRNSCTMSFWPVVYFTVFYYIFDNYLEMQFMDLFSLDREESSIDIGLFLYAWWFATLYFFSMNLIRFFFFLFLTECIEFPLVKYDVNVLTLQDAILVNNLPVIQNLACLDLHLLSQWSPSRRACFYQLSLPGGHPHNWNALVESVLQIFNEYTTAFRESTENSQLKDKRFIPQNEVVVTPAVQSPVNSTLKYRNLRHMTLTSDCLDVVDVSYDKPFDPQSPTFVTHTLEKLNKWFCFIKVILGINYFFDELPQVNLQKSLGNGHVLIWASQGISEVIVKSLAEDKYGIVQKDLPAIITSLVQLKQSLDKLSKVPALSRTFATLDDYNYKMRNAISAAVKRSLFDICLNFGEYFNEFPLSKEVLQYLQLHFMLKRIVY